MGQLTGLMSVGETVKISSNDFLLVTLGNRSTPPHSQGSQCMPIQAAMLAATLALRLTLGVGIT